MRPLPTVETPCPLCGDAGAEPVWTTPDRAFAVPGLYTVARCRGCGFLYQRPRVRDDALAACYPDHYPRHQEPSPRIPFRGSAARVRAVRWALASGLGYARFRDAETGPFTRRRADGRGPGRDAVRRSVVGARAATPPLALHAGHAGARGAPGGRASALVLAPGEAALLPLEPRESPSRARLAGPRPRGAVAAGVRRAEARAGGHATPGVPGAPGRGRQDRGGARVTLRSAATGPRRRRLPHAGLDAVLPVLQ